LDNTSVVTLNKCNVKRVLKAVPTSTNYAFCIFTTCVKGQEDMFPPEVRRYGGMTAEFKATSQHIPVELLKKISFRLEGHWTTDSKEENEKIFVAEKATEILPETESEVCKFLMRNCSSLGKTMANHIVERFGMNTLDVCAHHCKQLFDIPRIDDKVIAKLNDACLSALVRADVLKLLQGVDVSPSAINTLVETYGNETIYVLENNPYKPVPILGFAVMDQIALAMGEPVDSERRMTCATIEALHIACQKTGSMCAEESAILARMAALTPQVSAERQKESLDDVAKVYAIVKQGKYYYDKDDFLAERKMSAKIVELASAEPVKEREIEEAFIRWQKENAIVLSPRQAEAVRNLKYRISIVTGGPGTGKTTCLRAIMDVYHMVWPEEHILLMAPTGLAAKRMAESTGMNSSTIHKACGLVPANNPSGFTAQGDCTICGFIGIDEMSMVGEHLFAYAIDAVLSSPSTRIVLLGDTDQLAPVARGDVLRDLIKCRVIKTVRLDVNYRQGSTSTITDASIKIRENRAYTGNTRNLVFDDEFRFVPVTDKDKEKEANEIMNHIVEEYLNGVSKYGMEGTIVLTPTHYDKGTPSGYLCKNRVNAAIQAVVNPKTDDKLCVEMGKQLFMVGDRIIQRKNTEQVINGDLGTIQSIAQLESDIAVEIYFDSKGETLVYNNEDMKNIELAYAITVHSSQGCEFPCCIIPVSMTYGVMLTKPLYYTGITRAKKKLVMIGDEEALKYALQNSRKQTRKSLLGPRIITKLKKAES
jgi:exodeoxyribonuclease V alpha subunit